MKKVPHSLCATRDTHTMHAYVYIVEGRRATQHQQQCKGKKTKGQIGQIAVEMGFVASADIRKALTVQKEEDQAGKPHRLLGLILVAEGILSTEQLIRILKHMERKRKLLAVMARRPAIHSN